MDRVYDLKKDIERLRRRIIRLGGRAVRVEKGETEEKEKTDKAGEFAGGERNRRTHHNSAVAYWKEVRETEKRLDEKRAELRALLQSDKPDGIEVRVVFDEGAGSKPGRKCGE